MNDPDAYLTRIFGDYMKLEVLLSALNLDMKVLKKQNIKKIGVIATEGTIRSGAWEKNLKESIKNKR